MLDEIVAIIFLTFLIRSIIWSYNSKLFSVKAKI